MILHVKVKTPVGDENLYVESRGISKKQAIYDLRGIVDENFPDNKGYELAGGLQPITEDE